MGSVRVLTSQPRRWGSNGSSSQGLSAGIRAFLSYLKTYRGSPEGTLEAYASDLRSLLTFLHANYPALQTPPQITREVLMDWALSLNRMAPRSVRRKVACASSLFAFLQDAGRMESNPARRLPLPALPRRVPRILSQEEARRLVRAARSPYARCLLLVMLTTGIRRGEAARAQLSDLNLRNRVLLVHGKGAKDRTVPLCPQALRAIEDYLPWRPESGSPQLWLNERGSGLTNKAINLLVGRVARQAGLQGITPHRLRHTFATELIRARVDIRTVQELLGHSDIQSTAVYLHSDIHLKGRAVARLPKLGP